MKPEMAGTDAFDLLIDALGGLNEGCALFDEDGQLIVSNELFREMNLPVREFVQPGVHWETMLREMARRRVVPQAIGREEVWVRQILDASDSNDAFEVERAEGTVTSVRVRPTSRGGFIVSETDITERRRAEKLARESEQLLSTLLEASPANLCMSEIGDGSIVYQSPASVDLFGHAHSARDQFAQPLERADFLTELLASDRVDDFSATARRRDGSEFPALFSARVIDYRNEEVMVSTVTDLTETVAAERTIKEAGVRLRDAIEALSEGFILYDADEKVVMANQRFREMNAPYADKIVPGTHTRVLLSAAIETGHVVDAEVWLRDYEEELARGEGGSHRTFEFRMADGTCINSVRRPTRDGGFVITWLDVTDEKLATAELARANDRMRDAIDSVDEGFALFDKQDRLVMWNRRYEELNAHVADVIQHGAHFPAILQRSVDSELLEPDAEARTRRFIQERDYHHRARDEFQLKNGRWFSVTHSPTSEGGFVVTRHDITEQKASAAELARLKDRLEDAIESLDEGFALYDAEDRLIAWNTRYAELNRSIAHVIQEGSTYQEILETAIRDKQLDDDEAAIVRSSGSRRGGNKRMRFDFESREGRWFTVTRNPTSEDGFVITRADITERKLAEEELDRQREMLHQSEKLSALGELLAGVAHELNNPLSVVVGHALMLEEELADPAVLKRTKKISAAAERCSRIVKTFLSMARQRPTELELTSMNSIVETAMEIAGYGLRSAGVTVHQDLADGLPQVNADTDQLVQVLANLIVNAEHVLSPLGTDGELRISTRLSRSGNDVVLDVFDNGPGIPEKIRARIFEPFFTTKTIGEGTGIGLAFCHRVITTHEGTIQALEAPGGGARFSIRLAAAGRDFKVDNDTAEATPGVGQVLVIDDEEDVAELIAHILDRDGYKVTIVHSAEDALERLPGTFDLILSDINMPGLSGKDLLIAMNERWPGLDARLGFITGDTMSTGAEEFLVQAGRPYLEKPITPSDLRALAARVLTDNRGVEHERARPTSHPGLR